MDLEKEINQLIELAIQEDLRTGDITTQACIPSQAIASGRFLLKQAGVIAGLPFLKTLFKKINPAVEIEILVKEGSFQKAGTIIAKISGPAAAIITGERVALNFIQHASGVATITHAYVRRVAGFNCAILDTRRTMPGLRCLEKYAVKVGGGQNHRFGLDDRFIIKLNHLPFITPASQHPILQAVKNVRALSPHHPIEIEVEKIEHLDSALKTDAEAIILVNMVPKEITQSIKKIRKTGKKIYIQSGGTITLDTIRAYAELGPDGISIGALTHSIDALDISLRIERIHK